METEVPPGLESETADSEVTRHKAYRVTGAGQQNSQHACSGAHAAEAGLYATERLQTPNNTCGPS